MCSFAFNDATIRSEEFAGHHAEASETLGEDIALYVSVVILGGPDEPAGRLDSLCDHIIDQTVLVIDSESLKFRFVLSKKVTPSTWFKRLANRRGLRVINFLEDVLESTIVFLEDGVLSRHKLEDDASVRGKLHVVVGNILPAASSWPGPS